MLPSNLAPLLTETETLGGLAALVGIIAVVALPPLLLIRQVRRQPYDQIGSVKRDAHKGMLRAMLLLYLGVFLTAGSLGAASGPNGGTYVIAWGPMLFGGLALLARSAKYFLRTKPRLDALAFVGSQPAASLAWTPPQQTTGRGFWGWVRFVAISFIVLGIGAKVLYALSTTTNPQPTRVVGQATVPARIKTQTPTNVPRAIPISRPTFAVTAVSTQVLRPTAVPTIPERWGFYEEFVEDTLAETAEDGEATWNVDDGLMSIHIRQPDVTWWFTLGPSAEDRDTRFRVDVASTSGAGNVAILVLDDAENPIWVFNVFPSSRQWSVDRMSDARGELFNWVTPRSYPGSPSGHTIIEVEVRDNVPTLFIDGHNVMAPARIHLDPVPGLQKYGWGAAGEGFTAEFASISLRQASPQ